ncbi:MAG TPA: hypothetical protein VGH32_06765 [Pirellulales bacterium]
MTALDEPTEMDFVETPLKDVVEALQIRHGIQIQLDSKAITDAGGSLDMPITRQLKGVSLRSALRLMLREHELDFAVADEVLVVTGSEGGRALRQYEVGDLISDDAPLGALVEAVRFALPRKGPEGVAPEAGGAAPAPQPTAGFAPGGGGAAPNVDASAVDGEVTTFGTVLLVRTSERGQMDVSTLLAEMRHRRATGQSGDGGPARAGKTGTSPQPVAGR